MTRGSDTRRGTKRLRRGPVVVALTLGALGAASAAVAFTNSAAITINDPTCAPAPCAGAAIASPYPSAITVSGGPASISSVTVELFGFKHNRPDDVDAALVGPNSGKVTLMSDAGTGCNLCDPNGINLIFRDSAPTSLPENDLVSAGTWKPTDYVETGSNNTAFLCTTGSNPDTWPSGGPGTGPFSTSLDSTFQSANANGTWNLYVVDDCREPFNGAGTIASGWAIAFNGQPTAVGVAGLEARPSRRGIVLTWRTASEAEILGFNVSRVTGSRSARLNPKLIPAKLSGRPAGTSYRLVDRRTRADRSYTYRLQVVRLDGTRVWAAAVAVSARIPRPS